MGKYYIFKATLEGAKKKDVNVIFNPEPVLDIHSLSNEIKDFFKDNHQASALIFIHCKNDFDFRASIENNSDIVFKGIPKLEEKTLTNNIIYIEYDDKNYKIHDDKIGLKRQLSSVINQGLANIFVKNGGLVEASGVSHHFVFPSGKHSAKFLRTANVLVRKSEIDYIALNALHKFNDIKIKNIYCDTLSINIVAYSISNLINRYENNNFINIESFKSYDGIYNKETTFLNNSIFLISASTSGGLIEYLKRNHGEIIEYKNVCVLYYLPLESGSETIKERVVCNLEKSKAMQYGIDKFEQSRSSEMCSFCNLKSTPIRILGDSFNLDEPIINRRNIIASKYITARLKDFVELFKYKKKIGTALKVSYAENNFNNERYNLYIDYEKVISNITFYEKHQTKLDSFINQFVPASTKLIIYLNDTGSEILSKYIKSKIENFKNEEIKIINQSNLDEDNIPSNEEGSVLIVASCITNGKNLLYLNRFFRNFEKLRLIYFIGINRISDDLKYKELKSNIKYGLYGPDNSSFIEVETLHCDNFNGETSWDKELNLWKDVRQGIQKVPAFLRRRISQIENFESNESKGGDKNIFLPTLKNRELKIRKNSAFFNGNDYHNKITQSDVYFTICCVLNNMRNNKIDGLFQTSFVRNLIDPLIFNRFNDGIIQASILRGAKDDELNYSYSIQASEDMLMLLNTLIEHHDEYQGEALLEFTFALAIGKLRLNKLHYPSLLRALSDLNNNNINFWYC